MSRDWRKPRCASNKAAWRTRGDANRALERIAVENAQAIAPRPAPTGVYKCRCNAWHLKGIPVERPDLRELKPVCTSDKVSYYTRQDAEAARETVIAEHFAHQEHRPYLCDRCGKWHLTTQAVRTPKVKAGRKRTRSAGQRHLSVAPESLAAPPQRPPEPKPEVVAYSPTDPITRARRARWAALQGENVRDHLAHPFPWKRAA